MENPIKFGLILLTIMALFLSVVSVMMVYTTPSNDKQGQMLTAVMVIGTLGVWLRIRKTAKQLNKSK